MFVSGEHEHASFTITILYVRPDLGATEQMNIEDRLRQGLFEGRSKIETGGIQISEDVVIGRRGFNEVFQP